MNNVKPILVGIILIVGGAASAFFFVAAQPLAPPSRPTSAEIDQEAVKVVCGLGYVEPVNEVRSLSFKGGGVIAKCQAEIGSRVRCGEVLMTLDDASERCELAQAENEFKLALALRDDVLAGVNKYEIEAAERALDLARERLAHAEKELQRDRELVRTSSVARAEFDAKETASRQAAAELRRAEAQLEHLRHFVTLTCAAVAEAKVQVALGQKDLAARKVADMQLTAPMDGTVLEILRREGEAVSALTHEPVLLFADVSRLRVRAEIDERYLSAIEVGQKVTVSGRSLGARKYLGRISTIKNIMGKKTVFTRSSAERRDLDVVQLFLEMGPDFRVPAGLRVDVAIDLGSKRVES